jgi:hypothetical protein
MPAVGMSTGDVRELEKGRFFLTMSAGILVANNMTFQMIREHEQLYCSWEQRCAELDKQVREYLADVRKVSENCFGIERLKDSQKWNKTYVGSHYIGVPDGNFVEALVALANLCQGKEGAEKLCKRALRLADVLQPYTTLQKLMWEIRKKCSHKGFPIICDDMLMLNAPAASGLSSIHTKNAGDDLRRALPTASDLVIIGGQAGTTQVPHFGGGDLQGEGYTMLLPKDAFFATVRANIDASEELGQKWLKLAKAEGLSSATQDWMIATAPFKRDAVKEIVPNLVASRVLGFHLDLMAGKSTRTMHLRPVIAEAALLAGQSVVDQYGCQVLRRNWENVLVETKDSYNGFRSVFDEPEAA